jgi:probable HAF family extracellular repeat protein
MNRNAVLLAILVAAGRLSAGPFTITDLGTLGGTNSSASAINSSGQITGVSLLAGNSTSNGFLYQLGSMASIGALTNGPGGGSDGVDINSAGEIAGFSVSPGGGNHAILYNGTLMVDLGTLGGSFSLGKGINDSGDVVGYGLLADGTIRGFVYNGTSMTQLGTLGGTFSEAYGINDAGEIVGEASETGNSVTHAVVFSGGSVIDLGALPGGANSYAYAVNASGKVTGVADTFSGEDAFLYNGTHMIDLGNLGGLSQGLGINDSGEVVGMSVLGAFLYDGVSMINLNADLPAGSDFTFLSSANGINDAGQIVGVGTTATGQHAFLLTPTSESIATPEPATLVLFALGLGAWVGRLRASRP